MRVAVLGSGRMGETVIRHLRGCELVREITAYDPRPERLAELRQRLGVETAGDLESVLSDRGIAVVFITAPNDAHEELTLRSLEAGKAVMCEKPMAISLAGAERMVAAAERTGGFLQVGFELRYSRLYTTVKRWIDEGRLGRVVNAQCTYLCSEFWGAQSWRLRQEGSGGMFGEKLSHYADLARWWVGREVEEVYAASAPNVVPYFQIRDNYHATYRFAGGAVGQITFMMAAAASFDGDPLQNAVDQQRGDGHALRYLVMGDAGVAETDVFNRTIKRWEYTHSPAGLKSRLVETLRWGSDEDHVYFHNTQDQARDIVRRVAEGRPPSIAPRDALTTMRLCAAAELSADEARIVRLEEVVAAGGREQEARPQPVHARPS